MNKKYTLSVIFIFVLLSSLQAQVCKKVEIANTPLQKRLLLQYVRDCKQGRYFVEEIGIISMTVYRDAKGQQVWSMAAMIDDRYQDDPPTTYSILGDVVVLVYQADSMGRRINAPNKDKDSLNHCLEKIIGNRVYRRPLVKNRYIEAPGPNGTIRKGLITTLRYDGNYWNEQTIIYNNDNTNYKTIVGITIKNNMED